MKWVCLGVVALALFLCGLEYYPGLFGDIYTAEQPRTEDLIGAYVPDEKTLNLIHDRGHYADADSSISLLPDGKFIMKNIPDWWVRDGESHGGFISSEGRWRLGHGQWWVIEAEFSAPAIFLSTKINGAEFLLSGDKPPYKIHIIVGDPDEGKGMDFVTKSSR